MSKVLDMAIVVTGRLDSSLANSFDSIGRKLNSLKKEINTLETGSGDFKRIEALKGQYSRLEKLKSKQDAAMQSFFNAKNNLFATASAALTALPIKKAVDAAMEFESTMADIKKVVDFDSDAQFKAMGKSILEMSQRLPMAADDIGKIVAAGGQAGIAKTELAQFAESAVKMGVAFDITADQAGDMMAKWRTAFKMNQEDVVKLADKINYLGNTTAAAAPLISDVVTRIGPLGAVGGLASGEIAAMGASLVGSGIQSEVAATGLKNFILTMTAGESATKKQHEAFAMLGLDAGNMAVKMQKDAKGAILEVLAAINSLDKVQQNAVLKDLFGKESISAIAPLLTNLDNLKKNFEGVADAAQYGGSMEKEFASRNATTANQMQLAKNAANALAVNIGTMLLPTVSTVLKSLAGVTKWMSDFATKYPNVTQGILLLAGAVTAFVLACMAIKTVVTAVKAVTLAFQLMNITILATPVGWIILAVMAIVGVLIYLWNNSESFRTFWIEVWEAAKTAVSNAWEWIKQTVADGVEKVKQYYQSLKDFMAHPIDTIVRFHEEHMANRKKPVAENAEGGIYDRGAFLTTFAEESGESAIPHTPTRRNIGLLAETNRIMGNPLGGGAVNATFAPVINISGSADVGQINTLMEDKMREFEAMLARVAQRNRRLSYE